MNNISKKLFLALTFACVIAIIVFCIQLIVINSGVEPKQPDSAIIGSPPVTGNENGGGQDDPDPGIDNTLEPPTARPPSQGQRNEILINSETGTKLIVYARTELFELVQNDLDWLFNYKGTGTAALEISFVFVSPQGAAADVETFLNRRTGGNGAEYRGEHSLQGSAISGYQANATAAGVSYEAWIYQMSGSDLALAFVINYTNNEQRDALYEVLSSIDIE